MHPQKVVFSLLLGLFCFPFASSEKSAFTFYGNQNNPKVIRGVPSSDDVEWVSYGEYSSSSHHISNFAQLYIASSNKFSDDDQLFAAGFLEAYMTAESIYQHYNNMLCQVDCSGDVPSDLSDFFHKQEAWMRAKVEANTDCPYWSFLGGLLSQKDGLMAGYNASTFSAQHPLTPWAFTMLNSLGDMLDVLPAVSDARRPPFENMSYHEATTYFRRNGRCSVLFKVTDDFSDIYMGHNTWFVYSSMLRIYKTYEFNLQNSASVATKMSFSSYPATLASTDDFYLIGGSKMAMLQTTNNIFNHSLWDLIVPESLLAWQRVRTANQLANSGPEWFNIVSKYNSGTYNNMYMVLDGKKFAPGNSLQPETLFVIEQIPGKVVGSDVTDVLAKGYWSSYNVPYHQDIYLESGYGSVDIKANHAIFTEYQMAQRATIFRREEGGIFDMQSMEYVMRQNDFQTDPVANGDPWGAISARGDLDPSSPYGGGGTDTKISTWTALSGGTLEARIVNGPTTQNQKPFQWSTAAGSIATENSHLGQPDSFNFEFETVSGVSTHHR